MKFENKFEKKNKQKKLILPRNETILHFTSVI